MSTAEKGLKSERVYLRVSEAQRELIREAARERHKDLTSFVLDAVMEQVDDVLSERRVFRLGDDRWDRFVQALDRPVTPLSRKSRLKRLLEEPSILER